MLTAGEFMRLKALQREGLSSSQVAELIGCSERTVRNWFRREHYDRQAKSQSPGLLDPFKDEIRTWLHEYEGYTAQQLFQKITESGYSGGYTLVKDYVRQVRPPKRQEAHGEYDWAPGECAQVDFGECGKIRVGNELRKVHVFSMVLSWSRMMYLRFVMGESMEYFLRGCNLIIFTSCGTLQRNSTQDEMHA